MPTDPSTSAGINSEVVDRLVAEGKVRASLPPPPERALLRMKHGLLPGEVAEACGVTRTAVVRWERGDREPRGHARTIYAAILRRLEQEPSA